MVDRIDVIKEKRHDGWAVVVRDKHATHESTGMATEEEADEKVAKVMKLIHENFDVISDA